MIKYHCIIIDIASNNIISDIFTLIVSNDKILYIINDNLFNDKIHN